MHSILPSAPLKPYPEAVEPARGTFRALVLDGHPRIDSFNTAIASRIHAAIAGTEGQISHLIRVSDLDFDPDYVPGGVLEPCLQDAQRLLMESDCVVLVHPVWWGTVPTVMKGFLDRILTPGFAFEVLPGGGFRGMFPGKSALILNTMDTPPWVYRWLLRAPGTRMMRTAVLNFCGIRQVRARAFGPVESSTPAQRAEWLEQVAKEGASLRRSFRDGWRPKLAAWLKVVRPQFYVVPLFTVFAGALFAVAGAGEMMNVPMLAAALLAAFLMEFSAVLTNELNDETTDALNENNSPFNGGSRMLVEQRLTRSELNNGRFCVWALLLLVTGLIWWIDSAAAPVMTGLLVLGAGLAHFYTGGPLKLVYRSLGEPVFAFTNGMFVLGLGMASQGGFFPWQTFFAIGVPLSLGILAAITLAGLPDEEADGAAGKETWVVRFGRPAAAGIAMVAAPLAAMLFAVFGPAAFVWKLIALVHAGFLVWRLASYRQAACPPGRIDGLLVLALSLLVWLILGPFLHAVAAAP